MKIEFPVVITIDNVEFIKCPLCQSVIVSDTQEMHEMYHIEMEKSINKRIDENVQDIKRMLQTEVIPSLGRLESKAESTEKNIESFKSFVYKKLGN